MPREAAYKILGRIRKENAWGERLMDSVQLSGPDLALASRIVYGVTQNRILLDAIIDRLSSLPPSRIEPQTRDILRMGIFQLWFFDRLPIHAVVNESVELAKKHLRHGTAGFINAILRRAASGRPPELDSPELSLKYSHPEWLTRRFIERFGEKRTECAFRYHNSEPEIYARPNPLRNTDMSGYEKHPYVENCYKLPRGGNISVAGDGTVLIADPAAMLAVQAAAPKPGERILDICAAPGGKSFLTAFSTLDKAEITAFDLHEHRIKRMKLSAERLGIRSIKAETRDARHIPKNPGFDLVIADLPCSGTGVIAKKPDIRYKPEPEASLLKAQSELLASAACAVRPGGRLLYVTCSVLSEENEDRLDFFLEEHKDFEPLGFDLPVGATSRLQLCPAEYATDGFFIALLRRRI